MYVILRDKLIVTTAINLPGPWACQRLVDFGVQVIKVEPPQGDPLNIYNSGWYNKVNANQKIISLDLKSVEDQKQFQELLKKADLLITSQLEESLTKLGIDDNSLQSYKNLSVIHIFSYKDNKNLPGHDLNFQAENGLLNSPKLPRTLIADRMGAERVVQRALLSFLSNTKNIWEVILNDVAQELAEPYQMGATSEGGLLGGGLKEYNIYATKDGWVALAALEPRFHKTLDEEIKGQSLEEFFNSKTTNECQKWAQAKDLPISEVKLAKL